MKNTDGFVILYASDRTLLIKTASIGSIVIARAKNNTISVTINHHTIEIDSSQLAKLLNCVGLYNASDQHEILYASGAIDLDRQIETSTTAG